MSSAGTAETKIKPFEYVNVEVAEKPSEIAELLTHVMAT